MKIIKVTDPKLKSEICESILRSLPDWFGIESSIINYIRDVQGMETWVSYEGNAPIGFASIKRHFGEAAEIHIMGILEKYHRQGVGLQLIKEIENDLRQKHVQFLTVKTLSESRPCREYDQTRSFYLKSGFTPLEEFKTLWGEENPCLFLVKRL